MRVLYFDCGMGAAGDMISAALLELLPDKQAFVERLNAIGIPDVVYEAAAMNKSGVLGTKMNVLIHGLEEDEEFHAGHDHEQEHMHDHEAEYAHGHVHTHENEHHSGEDAHEHGHSHHHASLSDIERIVSGLSIPEEVKKDVLSVYQIIGDAESSVHGVPVSQIHFHEVGTMDAVADITAACLLMHELAPDKVMASPVHVGSGTVRCAHGILPVPAPATALILADVPVYAADIKGELCTPTGAALLKYYVSEFTKLPAMKIRAVGYGMGKKEFARLNCVRALLGETDGSRDDIVELSCNIDDMTGEDLAFAMDRILDAGAKDVCTVPIMMKKSRPAVMLKVMCLPDDREAVISAIFRYTSTIGMRECVQKRYVLDRKEERIETPYGQVRIKTCSGYGVQKKKPEWEDLVKAAEVSGTGTAVVRNAVIRKLENE